MNLLDLPSEILTEIFGHCEPENIRQTCHYLASIPSFWSSIRLGPSQCSVSEAEDLLRARLQRAIGSSLHVSIGPVERLVAGLSGLCAILSEDGGRIARLDVSADDTTLAGITVSSIFGHQNTFPNLETLSIRVAIDDDFNEEEEPITEWPQLDVVLANAAEMFPNLKILSLSDFFGCIPIITERSSFENLHTLILDGTDQYFAPTCVGLVADLLHHTPQLETLWLKHRFRDQAVHGAGPTYPIPVKNKHTISLHIHLPRLTQLAVAVPGSACNLLSLIEAPVLRDLHIDGGRNPEDSHPDKYWADWSIRWVQDALKQCSSRTSGLRRLAVTSAYLTQKGWEWLLFGDGFKPPFPHLESIALHDLVEIAPYGGYGNKIPCGFNDALQQTRSQTPLIPLRRLAILGCTFTLEAPTLVKMFQGIISDDPNSQYELEYDPICPQVTGNELEELVKAGVKLIRRSEGEIKGDEWWTQGHHIDATDSRAY